MNNEHRAANSSGPTGAGIVTPAEQERISAIVPARNEELAIAACLEGLLRQPEIVEIIVVNDQSNDRTAEIVRQRMADDSRIRLLETSGVPDGWVGKNNAAATGAASATQAWLLFVDADAELLAGAAARALELALASSAGLVSLSPEQITTRWYEKALIPFIFCRLASRFSYDAVNDPKSRTAAANGQFLMMHRSVYDAVGGHTSVANEVLEDVAIAKRVKSAGYALHFASGVGFVRTRMYRSFAAMWEGWKKNLYQLIGGKPSDFTSELGDVFPWVALLLMAGGVIFPLSLLAGVILLLVRQLSYGLELTRNRYPFRLIIYYVPAVVLYAGVLIASRRGHAKGTLAWKGRSVPARPAGKLS